MKYLITTILALVLVGCGESQSPEPPDISIYNAANDGNIEAVQQHLAAGTDVNAKNDFGSTPLIAAAHEGHKEIVELLIAKGADVDAMNEAEVTSLHYSALEGHKEITKLLLAKGADLNAKDNGGATPLDYANAIQKNNSPEVEATIKEIADLLRKHGGKTGEELKAEGK